jgi:hypothetical protein
MISIEWPPMLGAELACQIAPERSPRTSKSQTTS